MGFLDFFKAKQEKQSIELSIEEISAFVEKSVSGKQELLDETIAKKFSEIKFVLNQMKSSLNELQKQPLEGENAKLKKIVGTARDQTISRLSSLADRLQPPPATELDSVKQYCIEGEQLLSKEVEHSGKSIAYTGIYLKEAIKNLGHNVKELNEHFSFLNKKIGDFAAVFLQKPVEDSLKQLSEKSASVVAIEEKIEKTNNSLEELQKQKSSLHKKLLELNESKGFKELGSLQERKSSLFKEKQDNKTELVSLISSIDKPLKRFSKAVESNRYLISKELADALMQLQQNPLQLFKKDPKGETVKELLKELKKAIESGVVDLKDKEKSKRVSAINELLAFNFFSNVFWKLNELDRELQSIEHDLNKKPVLAEIASTNKKIKDCERAIQETGFSLENLKSQLEREQEELSSLRQRIEEMLQDISSSEVFLR